MQNVRIFAAVAALAVALAAPIPAAAAGLAPQPLGAVEGGQTITVTVPGLMTGEVCHSPVTVDVGGVSAAVLAAGGVGGDQVLLTLPPAVATGQTLTVAQCALSGSEPIQVLMPVVHTATATVTTEAGGQTAITAGARISISGSGLGVMGSGNVLLNGQTGQVQVLGWGYGDIMAVLSPSLSTGTYTLSVRTGGGTSNATTLHILSISASQALASGQTVSVPWATGGASSTHPPTGTPSRSRSGTRPTDNPGGGGRSGHGAAGWQWPLLVGLGSLSAALAALAPWRRKRRVGAGSVQVQTTEPEAEEAQAAAPETPEQDPEGGDES